MSERVELRLRAKVYRQLASIPTAGGHEVDRVLLAIADDLEHEAAILDANRGPRLAADAPAIAATRGRFR